MAGGRQLSLLALAAGVGVLGALAACDSFAGDEVGGPPADAGAQTLTDGAVDGGAQADALAPPQAEADAAAPFACPATYLLCDTFERTAVQGLWSFRFGPEGFLALDDTVASSATRSLRATPNGSSGSVLALDVSKPAITGVEVTFSLRIDSTEGDFSHVVAIELNRLTSYAIVEVRGELLTLVEQLDSPDGGVFYDLRPVATLSVGAFQRFRLRVDIQQGTFSLTPEKSPTGNVERSLLHKHSAVSTVLVGANFAGSRKAPHWVDDVVVTKF